MLEEEGIRQMFPFYLSNHVPTCYTIDVKTTSALHLA
jgi:hypothetical protein